MTEGKGLWGGGAACAPWKQARHGALGESTHDLSVETVSALGLSDEQVGGEELPTMLCVMVYSLLQDSALVPVKGPNLSVNRNITCRHGRWQDQITNLSPKCIFLCSLQLALIYSECISGPCLHLQALAPHPWLSQFWAPHFSLQAHPAAPAVVDLGLHYGSSNRLTRPVRIRSVLKKEEVCGREGREMAAHCRWVEHKSMGRAKGERRRLQPASNIGMREDFRNTKKKRRKGGK